MARVANFISNLAVTMTGWQKQQRVLESILKGLVSETVTFLVNTCVI